MTLNTRAVNHTHEIAPARDWRTRPLTQAAVFLLSWWACGASHAVDFPSLPLQTGVAQPAPNVIFILDDSTSMTSNDGDNLDTGLVWSNTSPNPFTDNDAGAPYTRNALSYNPKTKYQPWATANTTDTSLLRHPDANYAAAYSSLEYATAAKTSATTNLAGSTVTYYVPKPTATDLTDQTQYYRYQIRNAGTRIVRAEWASTAPQTMSTSVASTWSDIRGGEDYWGNTSDPTSGGNGDCANTNFRYTVPSDGSVSRVAIATTGATGTNDNPDLYVRYNSNPCNNNSSGYLARAATSSVNESLAIDEPTPGAVLYIGVHNSATGSGDRTFTALTLTVTVSTGPVGCSTAAENTAGWKNCTDITTSGDADTGVRTLTAEKQNYANWYQYFRTRMKAAKAGGSEVFASLDENYRVGLMGLYPDGDDAQILGGSMDAIIPVDNNGGLFVGANRKAWFDHLHGIRAILSTPLRQALNAAGVYYTSENAYRSKTDTETTYLACRQNFTILTTDGYWNNMFGVDPDSDYEGDKISGDEEDGFEVEGPDGELVKKPDGTKFLTYEKGAPYWYNFPDANDETSLADIAMHYWKTDLRTTDVSGYEGSADNRVPVSTANPAFWQHMVTFGVGLGVKGKLTDEQLAHVLAGTGSSDEEDGHFWPKPEHDTGGGTFPQNVDDLRHAALNARGAYINANNAEQFASGIKDALTRIGERRGSASNVLANSTSISTDSFVYQATYTAGAWRGELLAYPVTSDGLDDPDWFASENIRAWGSRKIFTAGVSGGGSAFPNSTQLADLADPADDLGLPNANALVDYLKGDDSNEKRDGGTGVLRARQMLNPKPDTDPGTPDEKIPALMGDIVDSSPFYVADNQTVFVGANDGMLHAIDASNTPAAGDKSSGGGTERFTYIPRGVAMSTLAEIAHPLYGTNEDTRPHRFFVDGPIVVSARSRTPGKNYLVGGLGRGGRGVYGLDVTNPASFGTSNVLWDETGEDEAPDNMGNVIAEPLISKLKSGATTITAAVVANGPNSKTGTASLFIIDLDTGETIAELDTTTTDNGLSAPRAVDVNADGVVDMFFAGDLKGTLWRFDVSDADKDNWKPEAVFTATDAGGNVQPISSAPGVARDPSTGNVWVFFGTGRYMTKDDQSSTDTQTYYGIIAGATGTENDGLARDKLQERSISVVDASGRRAFEAAGTMDADVYGWYVDLDNPAGTGERVISAPLLYDNILIFSSIVPASEDTVNSCSAGGSGYVNALDAFSGTSLSVPFFDLEDPMIGDVPVGFLPIGTGRPTAPIIIGDQLVVGDSSGGTPTSTDVSAPGGSSKKRVSWRELRKQ